FFPYHYMFCTVFFFYVPASTEIYTLSLHDALPIFVRDDRDLPLGLVVAHEGNLTGHLRYDRILLRLARLEQFGDARQTAGDVARDRKSTRLNSSHLGISYAVFCLKKKNTR